MNSPIQTEVLAKSAPRFTMAGQVLPTQLLRTDQCISQGLAKRLVRYAERSLDDAGMLGAVTGWQVTVSTPDAEDAPSERIYNVSWQNEKGGIIKVVGILTSRGWPMLDHGLDIEHNLHG